MDWIERVAERLDLPTGEKDHLLEELTDHFNQERSRLIAEGKTVHEAEAEAARILGDPREVAANLQTVHCRASWKAALLGALPFLLFALLPIMTLFDKCSNSPWGKHVDNSGKGPEWVLGTGAAAVILLAGVLAVILGISLLRMALREISMARISAWTVTALAVGVFLPIWAIKPLSDSALLHGLHLQPGLWEERLGVIAASYLLIALLAAVFRAAKISSQIKWIFVLATTLAIGCAIATTYEPWSYYGPLSKLTTLLFLGCAIVLICVLGGRVFAHPLYGNAAYWSLLLYSVYMSGCLFFPLLMIPTTATGRIAGFIGFGIIAAAASAIIFARCSEWRFKKLALLPGIVAGSLMIAFADDVQTYFWSGIIVAEHCALIASAFIYGVPALHALINSKRQPVPSARPVPD